MSDRIDSEQTVALLGMALETLKTSKAERDEARTNLAEAIAALEPLRAENSRINTTLDLLRTQVDKYEAEDAAEDAALAQIRDFMNPPVETPPVEDPPVENPPVEDLPNEDPTVDPPADEPKEEDL